MNIGDLTKVKKSNGCLSTSPNSSRSVFRIHPLKEMSSQRDGVVMTLNSDLLRTNTPL